MDCCFILGDAQSEDDLAEAILTLTLLDQLFYELF